MSRNRARHGAPHAPGRAVETQKIGDGGRCVPCPDRFSNGMPAATASRPRALAAAREPRSAQPRQRIGPCGLSAKTGDAPCERSFVVLPCLPLWPSGRWPRCPQHLLNPMVSASTTGSDAASAFSTAIAGDAGRQAMASAVAAGTLPPARRMMTDHRRAVAEGPITYLAQDAFGVPRRRDVRRRRAIVRSRSR